MDFDALTERASGWRLALESAAAFAVSLAFLLALSPEGPFSKELGVCESGAVRDVLAGNFILPHYTPGIPVQVPPMFWWGAALAVRWWGWNEIALRAPSIVATAITGAILYAWMASALNRTAALWSMPALLSSQYVADAARQPRMDAVLMMFLTAATVCLERALPIRADSAAGEQRSSRRLQFLAMAALSMGGAILTKGPLGVILPGLALAIFLALKGRIAELFRLEMIATFTVALAIGAAWYLAAFQAGGNAFVEFQIVHGLFRRFLGASAGIVGECQNPFYYFIPRVVSGFLPWSLFYPALAFLMWRDRAILPQPVTFAFCWFIAILGFFSISAGKCLVYILPLFPALAALTGWLIANAGERPRNSNFPARLFDTASILIGGGVLTIVIALFVLFFSGSGAALGAYLHRSDKRFFEVFMLAASRGSPRLLLWAALWTGGGIIVVISTVRGRALAQSAGIALIAMAGALFWYGLLNPALAGEETLKSFAPIVDRLVPPGNRVGYIGQFDCDLGFYSDHEITSSKHFKCGNESSDAYFIVWQDRLNGLEPAQKSCLQPLAQSAPVDSHGARILMIEKK